MQNEIDQKLEWETPVVVDLDMNNTEGKGVYATKEFETYAGPS